MLLRAIPWYRTGPWLLLTVSLVQAASAGSSQDKRPWREHDSRGAELYDRACASCHGANGRGAGESWVGFSEPLPDFTACDFATREPDADWVAVTAGGGPERGFAKMMPAFGIREARRCALKHHRVIESRG